VRKGEGAATGPARRYAASLFGWLRNALATGALERQAVLDALPHLVSGFGVALEQHCRRTQTGGRPRMRPPLPLLPCTAWDFPQQSNVTPWHA
jgi:hypothetical protein